MNRHFKDILDVMGEPTWWDAYGFPRYCDFHPGVQSYIYADVVALMQVACQACGHRFDVSVAFREGFITPNYRLPTKTDVGSFHYGDPPNVRCCLVGPAMNVDTLAVLQFWKWNSKKMEWQRKRKQEHKITEQSYGVG